MMTIAAGCVPVLIAPVVAFSQLKDTTSPSEARELSQPAMAAGCIER